MFVILKEKKIFSFKFFKPDLSLPPKYFQFEFLFFSRTNRVRRSVPLRRVTLGKRTLEMRV